MSSNSPSGFPSDWAFYTIGMMLILLGVAFFLIPLVARSGAFTNLKIPWILIYVYKDGFYFVTSPLLIILSIVAIVVYLLRR